MARSAVVVVLCALGLLASPALSRELLAAPAPAPAARVTATAPAPAPAGATYPTVYAALQALPQFSTLLAAVNKDTNLATGLAVNTTAVTFFAPTNTAIASFLAANNITAAQFLALPTLDRVLEYHVVPFALTTALLPNGQVLPTLLGNVPTWELTVDAEQIIMNGKNSTALLISGLLSEVTVTQSNILAGASVIQAVDGVLVPPEVVTKGNSTTLQNSVTSASI